MYDRKGHRKIIGPEGFKARCASLVGIPGWKTSAQAPGWKKLIMRQLRIIWRPHFVGVNILQVRLIIYYRSWLSINHILGNDFRLFCRPLGGSHVLHLLDYWTLVLDYCHHILSNPSPFWLWLQSAQCCRVVFSPNCKSNWCPKLRPSIPIDFLYFPRFLCWLANYWDGISMIGSCTIAFVVMPGSL